MNQPAVITRTTEMPEQGPSATIVISADRFTDDRIRGVGDKLTRSHRHEARTITRRPAGVPVDIDPQGSRCYNGSNTIIGASPTTDPEPASLGNGSTSVVTSTQDRPVLGPPGRRAGQPSSLGESSHPVTSGTLYKLLDAVLSHRLPRRGEGGYVRVTSRYPSPTGPATGSLSPPVTPPQVVNEVAEPSRPEILSPKGSVSGQPPRSINAAAAVVGLTSPRSTNASAYPYPTHRQPSVVVSQRCECGARRSHVAVDHHLARPAATFVCAICATRIARAA